MLYRELLLSFCPCLCRFSNELRLYKDLFMVIEYLVTEKKNVLEYFNNIRRSSGYRYDENINLIKFR